MMKQVILSTLVLIVSNSFVFASDSTKVQSPFTASLELSVKYMWRGIE